MIQFKVIKVESATDEEVEVIGVFEVEEHADKVAEMFNDEEYCQRFFYCVDEIWAQVNELKREDNMGEIPDCSPAGERI